MQLQPDQKAIVHVVDDDASIREALENLFLSIALEARTYATARDFVAAGVSDSPGCLVIDIRLPDMNGLDFQLRLTQTGVRLTNSEEHTSELQSLMRTSYAAF